MKVVCIDDSPGEDCAPQFKFGDILNISEISDFWKFQLMVHGLDWKNAVVVDEYPLSDDGMPAFWERKRFAPISDIDENEMERSYNKSKVLK